MATRHLSVRIDDETFRRLDARSRLVGQSRSELAKLLLDEGLRMEGHPGVVFRTGPFGRRPALLGGPDIWEVARVLRDLDPARGDPVDVTAETMDLSPEQVRVALRYYAEFQAEIDQWIDTVDDEAKRAEEIWLREQSIARR